jgi:hypothetical protein
MMKSLSAAVIALLLAACGGGGSDHEASMVDSADAATLSAAVPAPPSTSFDLSTYKLTLPIDRDGGTGGAAGTEFSAWTLNPEQLVAGFTDSYFRMDPGGALVFTAPANGAVTTPGSGSDHTRSELREFHRSGFEANGDWIGRGTLAADCTIRAAASTAPTIIVGQLRSEQQSLATIVYRPSSRQLGVDMYTRNEAGSPRVTTWFASGVSVGQPISYTMALDGGVLTAAVNGITRSFTLDASWTGAPLYFKLGRITRSRATPEIRTAR